MARDTLDWSKLRGTPFVKMTGSGNDFVFFDAREVDASLLTSPEVIRAICHRHNGIGADGIVILEGLSSAAPALAASNTHARIHYFNADGTPADLCGNATLCSTVMAVRLGLSSAEGMGLDTPSGRIASRVVNGIPEIRLQPVTLTRPEIDIDRASGEVRIGYAIVGIPHLVILCDDAEKVDLATRGPYLRRHPSTGAAGANVNWVSARPDGSWRYRTFERGVEDETLACGTGAVATAILLSTWGVATSPVTIRSSSGRDLVVALEGADGAWEPTLKGEGREVFRGQLGELLAEG
jgi:diaminopimelate epimerase